MFNLNTAPKRLKALLLICIIGVIVSISVNFLIYASTRHVAQTVGREAVPSIIAAKYMRATLANAHSNAMNAMATKEKLGGKFWALYRNDMNNLHSQLIGVSENINYGYEEREPIFTIMSNISAYEYTVGGAVSSDAEVNAEQFMEANRLMQQKILPASTALNKANLSQLNITYDIYRKSIAITTGLMLFLGSVFLAILIGIQYYLFKTSHRIFNAGLLLATILIAMNLVYSTTALNSIKNELYTAKQEAFDSLNYLWSAKAEAYNANALESLYLLHNNTGIVQSADTINFNLAANRIDNNSKKNEGYLNQALNNVTFEGEEASIKTAMQHWSKYVGIDKQIRNLEYDNKHDEAIALNVGDVNGKSKYEFENFDTAIEDAININGKKFEESINSAFKILNLFPYIMGSFLCLVIVACVIGLKQRIDEYK